MSETRRRCSVVAIFNMQARSDSQFQKLVSCAESNDRETIGLKIRAIINAIFWNFRASFDPKNFAKRVLSTQSGRIQNALRRRRIVARCSARSSSSDGLEILSVR